MHECHPAAAHQTEAMCKKRQMPPYQEAVSSSIKRIAFKLTNLNLTNDLTPLRLTSLYSSNSSPAPEHARRYQILCHLQLRLGLHQ